MQSAEQAYQKGDYSAAEKQYAQAAEKQPDAPPLQFNLGASAYKSGQYDTALPAFQKALDTDQVPVQEQAYYNIGNTQYRLGQKTEKSSPQDTIKTWQSAVQSYDAALKLKPDDADAKFNRDFVQKKLDELQKQQKQQQKARPAKAGQETGREAGSAESEPAIRSAEIAGSAKAARPARRINRSRINRRASRRSRTRSNRLTARPGEETAINKTKAASRATEGSAGPEAAARPPAIRIRNLLPMVRISNRRGPTEIRTPSSQRPRTARHSRSRLAQPFPTRTPPRNPERRALHKPTSPAK